MQSRSKPAPDKAARAHIDRLKALPCACCDLEIPCEIHEMKQGDWFTSMPLCSDCHRGQVNGLHGQKRMWSVLKLDELGALSKTIRRLFP